MVKGIIFYCCQHIGDTYLSQPHIKRFCEANGEMSFKYFCLYNQYIFSDIRNLSSLVEPVRYNNDSLISGSPPELCIENNNEYMNCRQLFCSRDTLPYFEFQHFVCINMWIGSWQSFSTIGLLECRLENLQQTFLQILDVVKHKYMLNITIPCFSTSQLFPIVPNTDISKFNDWNKNNEKITVFYFNYIGRSGQPLPFSSMNHHNEILDRLTSTFPNVNFIVPKSTIDRPNILCCQLQFDCIESMSCENIYKITQIAKQCTLCVMYDIGACFCMYNDDINYTVSTNQLVHIGVNDNFVARFKTTFELQSNTVNKPFPVTFKQSANINEVFTNIAAEISQHIKL